MYHGVFVNVVCVVVVVGCACDGCCDMLYVGVWCMFDVCDVEMWTYNVMFGV